MTTVTPAIVPRPAPNFAFDDTLPKYWFAGDAFKTRFFDALSTMFPEGEKYFIRSVRAYRDDITDLELQQAVRDFSYQEAQHHAAHGRFNEQLKAQGIDVDRFERVNRSYFDVLSRWLPRSVNLANTAAAEHLTAIIAHVWTDADVQADSDPRMRALLYWHGVEEIEHKAVAFDVMQKVAKVGYFTRVLSMAYESLSFPLAVSLYVDEMLRRDGFNTRQRVRIWIDGTRWLYGKGGLIRSLIPDYLAYFRPGFHPWQHGQMRTYAQWLEVYNRTGDAVAAGNAAA